MTELSCHWALRFVGLGIYKYNVTNPFPVNSTLGMMEIQVKGSMRLAALQGWSSHDGMVTSAAGQLSSLQSQSQSCLVSVSFRAISVGLTRGCLNGARSGISVKGYSFLGLLSLARLDLIFTRLQTGFS